MRADPGSLEQVLINLAVNARDAMPKGGRLTIGTDHVVLDGSKTDRPADATAGPSRRLTVTDTGSGIAQEHMPHVFEPFYTTKPQGQGTGLGLATVYGIVRQAGGHIRLSSSIGQRHRGGDLSASRARSPRGQHRGSRRQGGRRRRDSVAGRGRAVGPQRRRARADAGGLPRTAGLRRRRGTRGVPTGPPSASRW